MRHTLLLAGALLSSAITLGAQTTIGAGLTTSVGPFTKGPDGFQSVGQSFTVPTLNTQLSSFSLSLSNFFSGSSLRFDAYIYAFDAANRRIAGPSLWSALNIAGSSNDFAFDTKTFSTGSLSLSSGATYLFLLTTANQGPGVPLEAANLIGANDVDGYADGALWIASNGASTEALFASGAFATIDGVTDASFSATFAPGAAVVPEPAPVALTASGVIGVAVLVRRRRRSAVVAAASH